MSKILTMADLMAKQDKSHFGLTRGQELEGEVIAIYPQEIILDLGSKAEGVLLKKDLSQAEQDSLKVGDKLTVQVVTTENESGQVVVTSNKARTAGTANIKWDKFQNAKDTNQTLTGKGLEVNKGGLIVEVGGVRGFLPSSQVTLSQATNLEDLIGKDITVTVLEIDPTQNRLIFSQKTQVSEEVKENLGKLKIGDEVKGKVAAVLPFGIFITLENGVEGLVHISEISWEKVLDPATLFKVGDEVASQVISIDPNTHRVNLSIKQLQEDPFLKISEKYTKDNVVKGTISKVTNNGVLILLKDGFEGLIHSSKVEPGVEYKIGQEISCLVDSIDIAKRRIYLAPMLTTTKGLIYK